MANYKRAVATDSNNAYEPKSKLLSSEGNKMEWIPIFTEPKDAHLLLWEGDLDLVKALSLIKGINDPLETGWLDDLFEYTTESGMPSARMWFDIFNIIPL